MNLLGFSNFNAVSMMKARVASSASLGGSVRKLVFGRYADCAPGLGDGDVLDGSNWDGDETLMGSPSREIVSGWL